MEPITAALIRSRCTQSGITISEACRLANVHYSTFWRWSRGAGTMSVEQAQRLVRATEARGVVEAEAPSRARVV